MTELEILDSPETYVNVINLYRDCKSLVDLNTSYKFIEVKEQEETLLNRKVDKKLSSTALLISCGYSISMLGGDPAVLKASKSR